MPPDFCGLNIHSFLRSSFVAFACCLCSCLLSGIALADNWQAQIYGNSSPGALVGVDKSRRTFNFFEKKSPLRLRYSYPCVTGQLPGDKMQINDLRTPEGIYFVEYKIASGLDFREYGGIAYTLNYPNPVDRLRGKTGHGIWIHSKGFELVPTRGCVAIGLNDIAEIGPRLTPGTPVILAEHLNTAKGADNGTLAKLRGLMGEWSRAWAARSAKLFDFYDPDAYSKATENFAAFRLNKERLFKILSFIKIFNREIHALEGPGYWVTWTEQFYTASNLSTEGVRRLYWQKGEDGNFRIVGMEWIPRDVGMRADFQKGRLVAEGPVLTVSDASSEAPTAPRLDMPEQEESAKPDVPKIAPLQPEKNNNEAPERVNSALMASITTLAKNLLAIGEPLIPRRQPKREAPDEYSWGVGKTLHEPAPAPNADPAVPTPQVPVEEIAPKSVNTPAPAPKEEKPHGLTLDDPTRKALARAVKDWEKAFENRDPAIAALYDSVNYNRVPGAPKGQSYNTALRSLDKEMRQPWLMLMSREPAFDAKNNLARSQSEQMIVDGSACRQGIRELWWQRTKDGDFRIVASSFIPRKLGLETHYLEKIHGDVLSTLEAWRKAWEAADLDEYMSFYTPDAFQQGKVGQSSIRKQKEGLWSRVKPRVVKLTGLRVLPDGKGVRADMTQVYSDSAGRSDKGVKTLLLRYDGKKWLIQREDWANLAPAPQFRLP